ncbi:acetyl-CoA synthetase-like protein [Xylariaceae sp. FL0594]|nr:acetyl-CoA synthetase-like protein [Xylariaceae sp. FL0594]
MFQTTQDLIPNVIRRRSGRTRPYATVVGVDGFRQDVSFADLENFSNRAAWFLEKIPGDKVLYMGPNDVRYIVWLVAAMKTGKCVLFPSLANQVSANQRFFGTVGSKTLLYAPELKQLLAPLLDATRDVVEHIESPSYAELVDKSVAAPVYPFDKTFDEVKHVHFLGLHTSGTSGHPKPIFWNALAASTIAASCLDPSIYDASGNSLNLFGQLVDGTNLLVTFPLSHFGGMGFVMGTMFSDTTLVLPAPGTRLTPENYSLLLRSGLCTAAATPPILLEALVNYPPGLDVLASLKHVAYSGGAMNPTRGKALAEKLPHLFTVLASTEGGISRLVSTSGSSRWNAFNFVDVGQRMEEVSPGIFELVYPRSEQVNRIQAFFHTHPHLETEYRTSDLFSPLEGEDEGWWVYRGRADNWIAMSNGLKMDPTGIEDEISSHSDVSGVVVAGAHRFRLCLLVEVAASKINSDGDDSAIDHESLLDKLWPTIQAANMKAPKFGRIPRELVLFASPDKPFLLAGKGTIQRRLTVQAYDREISELYKNVEEGLLVGGVTAPSSMQTESLIPFLAELFSESLLSGEDEDNGRTIGPDDDLIALGLDSLSAFVLLAQLKAALRKYGFEKEKLREISPTLLYSASTIRQLAEKLARLHSFSNAVGDSDPEHDEIQRVMTELLDKYRAEVRTLALDKARDADGPRHDVTGDRDQVILLTGSTGSLGSYILASLLARPDVKKVFCLNRAASPVSAQESSFKLRGLPLSELSTASNTGRVKFFQVDPTAAQFGLPSADYEALAQETTNIVHNAYPVNFLLNLGTFVPHFEYLKNVMRFAMTARNTPEIAFVSSITATSPVPVGDTLVMAESVLEVDTATKSLLRQGYARSKYICERLLADYASITGNPASVLRVGQVCGPVSRTGSTRRYWNATEWLPSLVISSKFIGAVPSSLGPGSTAVDWVPVDKLGDMVCEIITNDTKQVGEGLRVFNIVHPCPASWSSLLPAVVEGVEPSEWIARLERSEKGSHIIRQNPAVKLVDFYTQMMLGAGTGMSGTIGASGSPAVKVGIDNLLGVSETARRLKSEKIGAEDMARWMRGWEGL